ncbi:hypothetical protein QBC32DRAFT_225860, partial [Pseudoneurospora amorphoporcata]
YTLKAATPNTPISTTNMASYAASSPNGAGRSDAHPIIGKNPSPEQSSTTPSATKPPSTTAASHLQSVALAPSTSKQNLPYLLKGSVERIWSDIDERVNPQCKQPTNITKPRALQMDAEGKFCCTYCLNTYSAAEHVASHMKIRRKF